MTGQADSILDELFHGCALLAFVEQAVRQGCWPCAAATRRRAYTFYEAVLAEKNERNRMTCQFTNGSDCGMVMVEPTQMEDDMHAAEYDSFDFSGLTVTERIDLAQRLWESVRDQVEAAPLTASEIAEIRSRIQAIDAGLMVCEPFDRVIVRAGRG